MKFQILLFVVFVWFSPNAKSQIDINGLKNSPWIPKKVNWKDGSFETFIFYNDSNFVRISASHALTRKDSIRFMIEAGFILYSGHYKVIKGTNEIALRYRLLYRIIRITGEKLPSDYIDQTIFFKSSKKNGVKNRE